MKQFEQNNNTQAISGFRAYISSFPSGIHALKANFYLAQAYFAENQKDKAIANYEYVVEHPRSEFTEQSLTRLGQILLDNGGKEKAIPVLLRLENEADLFQNKVFASSPVCMAEREIIICASLFTLSSVFGLFNTLSA